MPVKPTLAITAWLCFSLNAYFTPAYAEITDILPRIKTSVVGIGTFHPLRNPRIKLLGTGFAVADGHHVVSNAHVAPLLMDESKGESIAVFLRRGEGIDIRKAELVSTDREHDLLLLKIEGEALTPMPLANSNLAREGQTYYFTGFPIGAVLGLHPATHRAGLAAIAPVFSPPPGTQSLTSKLIKRAENPFLMFQLDATAYPGNSGSPLYDGDTGAVIGIINSVYVKGSKENALSSPSGITYAIPARYIEALLESSGIPKPQSGVTTN